MEPGQPKGEPELKAELKAELQGELQAEPTAEPKGILNTITGAVSSVFSSGGATANTRNVRFSEVDEAEVKPEVKPEVEAVKPVNTVNMVNTVNTVNPVIAVKPVITVKPVIPVVEPEPEPEVEPEVEPEAEAERAPIPKVKASRQIKATDSKSFFKARAKDVSQYTFTADGDLRVPSVGGEEAKVIPLPFYSPATSEEKQQIDTKRSEEIHSVEQEYDELSRQLSTAMDEWKSSGDFTDAIRLQKELLALDSRRTSLRSPLRWGKILANPTIKSVQMHETAVVDEKQQDLKLGYPVMTLVGRPYTFEQTVLPRKEKPRLEVVPELETSEVTFLLFGSPEDPEYGLLSPETPLEFVFNTTKYNSILQAYHVERVTQVGRTDMRATLLKLVNPKSIRGIGSRIVGKEAKEIDTPFELVKDIVKSVVLQDPRYAPLLRKTGTDTLIYTELQDKILGIGMSGDDVNSATNSTKWNGAHNLLGKAWEEVRKTLPAEAEAEGGSPEGVSPEGVSPEGGGVQQGGAVLESARTHADVKKERSKVLMGYYRRK